MSSTGEGQQHWQQLALQIPLNRAQDLEKLEFKRALIPTFPRAPECSIISRRYSESSSVLFIGAAAVRRVSSMLTQGEGSFPFLSFLIG